MRDPGIAGACVSEGMSHKRSDNSQFCVELCLAIKADYRYHVSG